MKRKMVSLLLAGTLLISLGGCGLFGSGVEKGTSEDENTLTVWCQGQASYEHSLEKAEAAYQQDNPEFRLEIVEYSQEQIQEKLSAAVRENAMEALPDMILAEDSFVTGEDAEELGDLFRPLDEAGIDFSQFDQSKTQQTSADGKQYGLPLDLGTVVLAVRADLLEKAGYTVDDFSDITWTQFLEQGRVVKEKTGLAMLVMIRDSQVQQRVPQDIYRQMKDDGIVIEVDSQDQYTSAVTGEEAAAVMDAYDVFGELMTASVAEGNWAVTNIPGDESQDRYMTTGGCSLLVTKNCEKTGLAFGFLKDTFGSDVDLYEELMKDLGFMGAYLPLRETEEYQHPQKYFSGQTVYILLSDYNQRALQNG